MKYLLIVFSALLVQSCVSTKPLDLSTVKTWPAKQTKNHAFLLDKPVVERLAIAPPAIMDYLRTMDDNPNYSPYTVTADDKALFQKYFNLLPSRYQAIMNQKVIAIYFIDQFMGGGMADFVFDQAGTMYSVVYLNPAAMHTSLQAWITARDQSPFLDNDAAIRLTVTTSDRYFGLIQTLVHEASHVYDYYFHVTPYVEPILADSSRTTNAFVDGIWQDYFQPAANANFPYHGQVHFYGLGKALPKTSAVEIYSRLNSGPFASLYGAGIWAEDFAESFTWYYLAKQLAIGYRVTINQSNGQALIFEPGNNPLVTARYRQLAPLLID